MFQNRKIVSNLYETGFCKCLFHDQIRHFSEPFNFDHFGTLEHFNLFKNLQPLTLEHCGTLQDTTPTTTNNHHTQRRPFTFNHLTPPDSCGIL